MLDHILTDTITSLRKSLENALLERQAMEERFQIDVFLGDVSWETSYSLPGEGRTPRVRADLSIDWPTWSQSAYRSWAIGEPTEDLPEMVVEIALRIERLKSLPDLRKVVEALPEESPTIGVETLVRSMPAVEQVFENDLDHYVFSIETTYQGTFRLEESVLERPSLLLPQIEEMARWIASNLVRLGDLELPFLPPETDDLGIGGTQL